MKKLAIALMALTLALSLAACGDEKEKNTDTPDNELTAQEGNTDTDNQGEETQDEPEEASLSAKGENCTITVPKLDTFIDGYEITDAGCNDSKAIQRLYVKLYREDPKVEINVGITQLTLSSAETQDAKGYAEYCNSKNLGPYEPVEIAGHTGYLKAKFSDSTKVSDNWYMIDYPLSDGTSMVLELYVGQKYADDTSAATQIAEAFLKNIEVAANNG